MWIKTKCGSLVNLETCTRIFIRNDIHVMVEFEQNTYTLQDFKSRDYAQDYIDKLAEKLVKVIKI